MESKGISQSTDDDPGESLEQIVDVVDGDNASENQPLPVILSPAQLRQKKKAAAAAATAETADTAVVTVTGSVATLSDGKLLSLLAARAVDSDVLKKKLQDLLGVRDFFQAERVNWGQWMASCAGQIPQAQWPSFRQDAYDLVCSYLPAPPIAPLPPVNPPSTTIVTTAGGSTPLVSRSLSEPSTSMSTTMSARPLFPDQQQQQQPQPLSGQQQQVQSFSGGTYMSQLQSGYYNYPTGQSPQFNQSMFPQSNQGQSSLVMPNIASIPGQYTSATTAPAGSRGERSSFSPNRFSNLNTPDCGNNSGSSALAGSFSPVIDSMNVLNTSQEAE